MERLRLSTGHLENSVTPLKSDDPFSLARRDRCVSNGESTWRTSVETVKVPFISARQMLAGLDR